MFFFFFKQKTAYELRISDWSSDVCSSDLYGNGRRAATTPCVRRRRNLAELHSCGGPQVTRRQFDENLFERALLRMQLDESPVALGRGGGDRLARIGVLAAADQEATVAERARAIDAFVAGQLDRFRRAPDATGDRRLFVGAYTRFVVGDHTARGDHPALTQRPDFTPD